MTEDATTLRVNPLVAQLAPPPIPAVQAFLRRYDGSRGPAVDLSQAVPGYRPHPDLLRWLGERAGDPALCGYGDIQGEAVLRAALARDIGRSYGAEVSAADIQITAGGNQAFFAVLLALLRSGDEVVLVRPFYFNHEMTLRMMGIDIRFVDGDAARGFAPDIADIAAAIGPKTRAVCVVTPNNPTGTVYQPRMLSALHTLCRDRDIFLIADETYRDFLPEPEKAAHALFDEPDWRDRFIHLYSFSKVFCIPGHRLGAIACGPVVMAQLQKVMDNLQICAPRPAQHAVAQGLAELSVWRRDNALEIAARRRLFETVLGKADGWQIASIGAYFAYLRHPFEDRDSMEVCARLAGEYGILTLPGACFGDNQAGFLRAAFANADLAAIARLEGRFPRG